MSQPGGDIQERIAAARREAEVLKEKIRASREASADTSRMFIPSIFFFDQSP
jgi:guanine nucleotide-binding protein G(I)/G(S)/G(T) subunit beta-1